MSYWVTTSGPSLSLPFCPEPFLDPLFCTHTGTYSSSGPGAMTTPAA